MARTVKEAKLETRAARSRLGAGPAEHWKTLQLGKLSLGWQRRRKDVAGVWIVRRFVGKSPEHKSGYVTRQLTLADDITEANGSTVLSFAEAEKVAHGTDATVAAHRVPTVADAVADYAQYRRMHCKPGSADRFELTARAHILGPLGHMRLDKLTLKGLEKWRDELAARPAQMRSRAGAAPRYRPTETEDQHRQRKETANRVQTDLIATLNRAAKRTLGLQGDAWRLLEKFRKTSANRPSHLSVAEAQRLINAADGPSGFKSLVQGALVTGCRYGELCRMVTSDYKDGRVTVRESKSGTPRPIKLTEEGAAFFAALCVGRPGDQPIFRRPDGSGWRPDNQARPMRAACVAAGIKPIGFHQLRHSWASLSVEAGLPLMLVAEVLGHADLRMVQKHYAHLSDDYRDKMIAAHAPRFGISPESNVVPMPMKEAS